MHGILPKYLENRTIYKTIVVNNPAAGANWSYTVENGKLFIPLTIAFLLTTSATVANRATFINYKSGANRLFTSRYVTATPENDAQYFSAAIQVNSISDTAAYSMNALPLTVLEGGEVIDVTTNNLQVGDQYSQIVIRGIEADITQPS